MGFKRKAGRMFRSLGRKVRRVITNRTTQRVVYSSYQIYEIARIIRNPFVLLQHLNLYNGLILLS